MNARISGPNKIVRSNKPSVRGHVAGSDPGLVAVRLKERIGKFGSQILWIADDGCYLAADSTSRVVRKAENIIGCYTSAALSSEIEADIEDARGEYAAAMVKARELA